MKPSKAGVKKPGAPETGTNGDQPVLSWTSRLWASVGLPWTITGVATYTLLTFLGRQFLHNPKGLERLREEVPPSVYDRSTSIFLTALAIDLLNIVFERQTIKLDCVLLPAFIKGMASTTNVLVRFFVPVMALTEAGRPVVVQRYICWMHTTPSILLLLKMISTTITPREALVAIVFDEIMVVTGVAALVTTGWQKVLWSIITHVAMLPVVPYMHKAFTECLGATRHHKGAPVWAAVEPQARGLVARAMEQVRTRPLQLTMLLIYVLNLLLWCTFAVTWDLALLGWISILTEEVLYVACDFSAKVLFSSTLMLSSFKEFEARRENAMRVIENSSKAKLITELQALLEQKERFMSSVSHELRTPLNGIIGISEGMLSGCCGVLPEGVRRQIYIIRTSGARLLALINDVMDAAALRQNKLVLKQEQVVLRHVVDDVLDLTRSLVDSEVMLANLVPPRMLVMGDTGRIVQILNNLLGNAAKFTRRGQIRVTARQVEGGRRVAVTVSDTGIGIPRNKLATIFLPFEQVDMSISRKYGGFGLGLNIVQELVKAHGGTINVSSIEGKGSAFTFTLPLARAMGRESLEEAKAAVQRGSNLVGTQDGSGEGRGGSGSGGIRSAAGASGTTVTGTTISASATASGVTPRICDGGGDDSSTVVSSSDASRRPVGRAGQGAGGNTPESELEQYGELMYNAAELSALASSRPYAQSVRDSIPASLEGSSQTAATQSPLIGSGMGGAARSSYPSKASPRPGKAAATPAPSTRPDAAIGDVKAVETATAAAAQSNLPGGETKIIHGPRPFHYTMYKRFLLLSVDDDPVNQSVIKSLLGSTGYEVVAVRSGAEALNYVSTSPALPDLVLLDCMMPEMDGYEVLQRLRAMTPNVHVPIIMVSAQTDEEHVVCGLDLGADDYVTKPFKRNELLARIRAQLAYGEWEHDEAALETISSLVAGDFHGHGVAEEHGGGEMESGNADGFATSATAATGSAVAGAGPAVATPAPLLQHARNSGQDGSGSIGDQRLIICIDDDDVNQVVLQGMLTSQHYRYVRASTGAQGLSYVCGTHNGGIPPDLVLLDCSLPDMTGFDVCRCIRQMYNKQQVPIIMLSARHNESAVVEGLKCGANTYVTKPFRRNELLARIRLHLRSREPSHGQSPSRGDSGAEDSDARNTSAGTTVMTETAGVTAGARHGTQRDAHTVAGTAVAAAAVHLVGGGAGPVAAAGAVEAAVGAGHALIGDVLEGGSGGVRIWTEAAVLVVAVADYAGLCRMLLPAEMAELSARMAMAFDHAVATYGAVRIEASSGVMSAAVLPSALPPLLPPSADADAVNAATATAAAAAGLRLAALHRVGRALLEAAAMLPVPGTSTCLQLQEALALGTIMGHSTAPAAGSTMLYFGPVLAELLDLARRAPPMTMVSPDGEAHALRASGATADIRGPLFLEPEDGAASGSGVVAVSGAAARRLWLVEAHPFAHQYLPPQLLSSNSVMRGSFFQRSLTLPEVDPPEKGSGSMTVAASMHLNSLATLLPSQPQPSTQLQHVPPRPPNLQQLQPRMVGGSPQGIPGPAGQLVPAAAAFPGQSLAAGGGGGGAAAAAGGGAGGGSSTSAAAATAGGGSPLTSLQMGVLMPGDPAAATSASNSIPGFNASLGLFGYGLGLSRAASRAFSQAAIHTGSDSEALGRLGLAQQPPPAPSFLMQPGIQLGSTNTSHTHLGNATGSNVSQGSGNVAAGTGSAAGATVAGIVMPATGNGGVSGISSSMSQHYGLGSPSGNELPSRRLDARESASGGPCITFSLQAAAAAVAAAAAAAAGGGSGNFSSPQEPFLMTYGTAQASVGGGFGGISGPLQSSSGLPGTSFLYGYNHRASSSASAAPNVLAGSSTCAAGILYPSLGGPSPGGGSALNVDPEAKAAEPQIRALRHELAAMRMQLEALQCSPGTRDPFPAMLMGTTPGPQPHSSSMHALNPSLGLALASHGAAAPRFAPQAGQHREESVHGFRMGGGGSVDGILAHHQTLLHAPQPSQQGAEPSQQHPQQLAEDVAVPAAAAVAAAPPPTSSAASTDGVGHSHVSTDKTAGKAPKKSSKFSRLFNRSGKSSFGK